MTTTAHSPSLQNKFRSLCLSFPGVTEAAVHGRPEFLVGKEPFAAIEEHAGSSCVAVRVGPEDYRERAAETRLLITKHVEKDGWLLLKLARDIDWDEVMDLVLMSYVAVAPKKMLQALDRTLRP